MLAGNVINFDLGSGLVYISLGPSPASVLSRDRHFLFAPILRGTFSKSGNLKPGAGRFSYEAKL